MDRKGQSALEYLMTYGWAILIIIIVGGVLYYYGYGWPPPTGAIFASIQEASKMNSGQAVVTASTRLPIRVYRRVTRFAQQRGLVTRSGRPNICQSLARLVHVGLDTVEQQGDKVGSTDGG